MYYLKTPNEIALEISESVRQRRIQMNITQKELAERSGVSFGSIKRFEQKGEISLKHLLQIAIVLRITDHFESLFMEKQYESIDEVIQDKKAVHRKRAGKNDT